VKQLPKLLRLIRETASAVTRAAPDILVIIDSPDFTHRVARRVRARDPSIPIIDYVSPRSGRGGRAGRARCCGYVDHVLALLPFEPEAYRRLHGPPCSYVGHPLTEQIDVLRPDADEQRRRDAAAAGSAGAAGKPPQRIRHHMAVFGETLGLLDEACRSNLILPTMPHLQDRFARA
jgi:lipid-A-disaccharide synthase